MAKKKTHQRNLERARANREAKGGRRTGGGGTSASGPGSNTKVIALGLIVVLAASIGAFAMFSNDDPPAIDDVNAFSTEDDGTTSDQTGDPATSQTEVPTVAGGCPVFEGEVPEPGLEPYDEPFAMNLTDGADYTAIIDTTCGAIEIDLFEDDAPLAVNNFVELSRDGYYDGVPFHRVIQGFMIQGGDPTGKGNGCVDAACEVRVPGYSFEDELDTVATYGFGRGRLAMANAGPNTNGSQFFIVQGDASHLTTHTVFGTVLEGLDVVDMIVAGPTTDGSSPVEPVRILGVQIIEA